jgi:Ni/Co efflux regulator RcnB
MLKFICSALVATALLAAPAITSAQAEEKKTTETAKPKKKGISAAVKAARERQKQCGVEWKEAKAAGKTKGQTWPKFWSACNKRLKEKSA